MKPARLHAILSPCFMPRPFDNLNDVHYGRMADDSSRIIGISFIEIHIRTIKRKLASCYGKDRLIFNSSLLRESMVFRSQILVHEMIHLKVPNHGKCSGHLWGAICMVINCYWSLWLNGNKIPKFLPA